MQVKPQKCNCQDKASDWEKKVKSSSTAGHLRKACAVATTTAAYRHRSYAKHDLV
jgi:hypothetical protein